MAHLTSKTVSAVSVIISIYYSLCENKIQSYMTE